MVRSEGGGDRRRPRGSVGRGPADDGQRHVLFPELDPITRLWTGAIVDVSAGEDESTVPIGDYLALPRRLTIRRGTVSIVVDNTNGAPSYTVTVTRASTGLLRRLRLQPLIEEALAHATTTTKERPRGDATGTRGLEQILAELGPLPAGVVLAGSGHGAPVCALESLRARTSSAQRGVQRRRDRRAQEGDARRRTPGVEVRHPRPGGRPGRTQRAKRRTKGTS